MRLRSYHKFLVLIVIFNLTFAAMCGTGKVDPTKVKDPKARVLLVASDDFAEAQKSTADLLATAKEQSLVSQEDINEIKPFLQEANDLNAIAIDYGKKLLANPSDTNSEKDLVDTLNRISATLVRANNVGLTRIKNPNTRAAFSSLIVTMQAAATSAIKVLNK